MDGPTSQRDAQISSRVIEGDTRVLIEFSPRVDFGRVPTRLEVQDDGLRVLGAGDSVQLVAPGVSWTVLEDGPHQRAVALVELPAGEPLVCEMRVGVEGAVPWRADEPERRRATMEYWSGWASTLRLPLVAPRMVLRSTLTLKALCYQPTGRDPRGCHHEPAGGDPRVSELGLPVLLGCATTRSRPTRC